MKKILTTTGWVGVGCTGILLLTGHIILPIATGVGTYLAFKKAKEALS